MRVQKPLFWCVLRTFFSIINVNFVGPSSRTFSYKNANAIQLPDNGYICKGQQKLYTHGGYSTHAVSCEDNCARTCTRYFHDMFDSLAFGFSACLVSKNYLRHLLRTANKGEVGNFSIGQGAILGYGILYMYVCVYIGSTHVSVRRQGTQRYHCSGNFCTRYKTTALHRYLHPVTVVNLSQTRQKNDVSVRIPVEHWEKHKRVWTCSVLIAFFCLRILW